MRKTLFKKCLPLCMSFALFLSSFGGTALAKSEETTTSTDTNSNAQVLEIGPRVATSVRIIPEITEIHGASSMKVRATWRDTGNLPLKATVTVTNGATLLARSEDDISFKSNNDTVERPITNLNLNEDLNEMTFITGANRMLQTSSIEFEVAAPLSIGEFDITVFLGKEDGTSISNITNTSTYHGINVMTGLSVTARNEDGEEIDQIDDYHPFYIDGTAWYKGGDAPDPTYLLAVITNKETEEVVGEYESIIEIHDREYAFGPIYMPSKFEEGTYVITVYMVNDDPINPQILGSSSTEVTYSKGPVTMLTIDLTDENGNKLTQVDQHQPFYIEGTAWIRSGDVPLPSYLLLVISNKETEEVIGEYEDLIEIVDDSYRYGPVSLPDKFDDGTYVITLYMVHDDYDNPQIIYSNNMEIDFVKTVEQSAERF